MSKILIYSVSFEDLALLVTVGYFWLNEELTKTEGGAFIGSIAGLGLIFALVLMFCRNNKVSHDRL